MVRTLTSAFLCLALCLPARGEGPPILKLFDIEIQDARKSELCSAIAHAGGAPKTSKNPNVAVFRADSIGLPGMRTLEVVYHSDQFVLAAYHSGSRVEAKADERLRKMLVEKYGPPRGSTAAEFTGKFLGEGRHTWNFARGMRIVYKKEFFGSVDLTYVDEARFMAVKQLAIAADEKDARDEARRKSNAF